MYEEADYLQLSGLQHFVFCRRQWALIHIENLWAENYRTADGTVMTLQAKLCKIIDDGKDSLRFYNLGNRYETRIEHFGTKASYDPEGFLEV